MILQPLVENSIRHGLANRLGPGRVEVRADADGSVLRLTVTDDGCGLGEGVLREGVGLGNTRARLTALYEGRAGVDIEPNPPGGTVVRVHLPARSIS